jgi:hypothetical protein
MIARQFRSPLLGTALVLMALTALAVPLHRLTARSGEVIREAAADPALHSETTRAVLRIRVLDTLEDVEIRASDDRILHQAKILEPGEVEADAEILLENNKIELHVTAQAGEKETALFITLLPDGHEESTAYVIGSGALDETLLFHWEQQHE